MPVPVHHPTPDPLAPLQPTATGHLERDNVVYWKTNGKINNDLPTGHLIHPALSGLHYPKSARQPTQHLQVPQYEVLAYSHSIHKLYNQVLKITHTLVSNHITIYLDYIT